MAAPEVDDEISRLTGYIAASQHNQRVVVGMAAVLFVLGLGAGMIPRSWSGYVQAGILSAAGFVLVLGLYIIWSHIAEWRERIEALKRKPR